MSIDYDRIRDAFMQVDVPFSWRVDDRPSKHNPEVTKFQVVGLDDSVVVEMEAEGEYAEVVERDLNFIALAPDMARELLRLRDGVKALVVEKRMWVDQLCDPYEEVLNPDWLAEVGGEEPIGLALEKVCRQLTDLLDGDTE